MKYYVKSEYEHGHKVGCDRLIETEKQHALERFKSVNKDINVMESNLDEMTKSLDMMKRRKRGIEQELIELGTDAGKIKEVSGEVEER